MPPPWRSPGFSPLCRAVWGPWVPAGAGLRCSEGLSRSPWCFPAQKILPGAFLRGGRASSLPCCGETEARHSERVAWGFPGVHGAAPEPSLCTKFGQILAPGASHPPCYSPPHTSEGGELNFGAVPIRPMRIAPHRREEEDKGDQEQREPSMERGERGPSPVPVSPGLSRFHEDTGTVRDASCRGHGEP